MTYSVLKEKVFFEWVFFLIINSVFYYFVAYGLLGPCQTPEDPIIILLIILAALAFFLGNIKYFKELQKSKKLVFTLIIVVITLFIAITARINTSCSRGSDAAIKATLSSLRAAGQLYKETNNSYVGFCASKEAEELLNNASRILLNIRSEQNSVACYDNQGAWASTAPLKNPKTANASFCVDSTGSAREVVSLPAGITVCQ